MTSPSPIAQLFMEPALWLAMAAFGAASLLFFVAGMLWTGGNRTPPNHRKFQP